ncbi:MAG: hypothetical protein ACK5KR_04245 [Breznakia sp.]
MGSYGGSKLFGGVISIATFMVLSPIDAGGMTYIGAQGLIFAMFVGLTAPTVLYKLQNIRALQIRMPEGIPPVIATSLNLLFPIAITLLAFATIQPA